MTASQADESSWAVLACRKCTEMSSHIAHAATRGERVPLLSLLKALLPMEGTVHATHGFTVFLDHFSRPPCRDGVLGPTSKRGYCGCARLHLGSLHPGESENQSRKPTH